MSFVQLYILRALNSSNLNPRNAFKDAYLIRSYHRGTKKNSLFSRISPLGNSNASVVPVLDQWLQEGRQSEIRDMIRRLRNSRRYSFALQISEWISSKGLLQFSPSDHAMHLDLIGSVHGPNAAESFFQNMSDQDKIAKTYAALLNCYVRGGLIDKSLSHMQKMKEMGFASNPLVYNNIMSLYSQAGQLEKIPDVFSEMKENGVSPNKFSYKICINSYGTRSHIKSMEKVLEEMENDPQISMDWTAYSTVASCYIKNGLSEKALIFLKKSEEKLNKNAVGYNFLISHYASLGKKDEVMRLWSLRKVTCNNIITKNREYIVMLGSLVKLDELEETEALLKEWESSCVYYDSRVPNVLLIGYCQKGMIEKAEALLQDMIERGKTPIPNSWSFLAEAYLDKQNMEKALECMKKALAVQAENEGWRPKPGLIRRILDWLHINGEVEEREAFLRSLEKVASGNWEMSNASDIDETTVDRGISDGMEADKIDEDEEEENLPGQCLVPE